MRSVFEPKVSLVHRVFHSSKQPIKFPLKKNNFKGISIKDVRDFQEVISPRFHPHTSEILATDAEYIISPSPCNHCEILTNMQ